MARIGLQTWGSEGDVQPFLALASGLHARGHDVELAMTTMAEKVYAAPGVTIHRVPPELAKADGDRLVGACLRERNPVAQARLIVRHALGPSERGMLEGARMLAERCDILVRHHMVHGAQVAAFERKRPEVSVYLTPELIPTRERMPNDSKLPRFFWGPAWWLGRKTIHGVFGGAADAFRAAAGMPRGTMVDDIWPSRDATIVAVSPALFPRPGDWSERIHMTGFLRGPITQHQALEPGLDAFLAKGAPPVYVTFGSMTPNDASELRQMSVLMIEAARLAEQRVIVQRAPGDEDLLGEDVLFVEQSPHAAQFPRCAAIVHHGGAGSTQTTVSSGTPAVIVPHLADQFFWARQLEQLGVAFAFAQRRGLRAAKLADALRRTHGLKARAATLAAELPREDGVSAACEVIERVLARG